jgi:hypothetical protein
MNKSSIAVSSTLGIIVSVVFIWIFAFSIWYSNNILNEEKFVSNTTKVLQSESVRNNISTEIIDTIKLKRPIIGSIGEPLLTKVVAGVLGSNLFAKVNTKIAQEIHLQLTTSNPRALTVDLKTTKDFLGPFVEIADPELLSNIPDQIVIVKRNQIPSLYKFGTYLTVLAPILLIIAVIILGLVWRNVTDKRSYIGILSLSFAASGLLVFFLVPALGNYFAAQADNVNTASIISQIYLVFTNPISQFAKILLAFGVLVALSARFLKKEIFRLPKNSSSK